MEEETMGDNKEGISKELFPKEELLNNYIKKPSTPHILDSQIGLTEQEMERREFIERELGQLGISTSVFDSYGGEKEDRDILEAIILVNEGKTIPEELKNKILEKRRKRDTYKDEN